MFKSSVGVINDLVVIQNGIYNIKYMLDKELFSCHLQIDSTLTLNTQPA